MGTVLGQQLRRCRLQQRIEARAQLGDVSFQASDFELQPGVLGHQAHFEIGEESDFSRPIWRAVFAYQTDAAL